jgi:hypothetical protein
VIGAIRSAQKAAKASGASGAQPTVEFKLMSAEDLVQVRSLFFFFSGFGFLCVLVPCALCLVRSPLRESVEGTRSQPASSFECSLCLSRACLGK